MDCLLPSRFALLCFCFASALGCARAPDVSSPAEVVSDERTTAPVELREAAVDACVGQRARAEEGIALPADFPSDVLPPRGYWLHRVDERPARTYELKTTGRAAVDVFDDAYNRMARQGWTLASASRANTGGRSTLVVEKPDRAVLMSFADEGCDVVAVDLRLRETRS